MRLTWFNVSGSDRVVRKSREDCHALYISDQAAGYISSHDDLPHQILGCLVTALAKRVCAIEA